MNSYTLPYFGEIQLDQLDLFYGVEATLPSERNISLHLNFESTQHNERVFSDIHHFIEQIELIDEKNVQAYVKDFKAGGETFAYIDSYLEAFFAGELDALIDPKQQEKSRQEQILQHLQLMSVGIYPERKDMQDVSYASFSYSINFEYETCDETLTIYVNHHGAIEKLVWEAH